MLYATPVALHLTVGGSATVLVTDQPMNVSSETVSLSVTGLPTGVTASFNPVSTTGASVLTLTAGSTAAAGTSAVTLTGVSGSITQTAALTLAIVAATPGTSRVSLSSAFNRAAIYTDGSTFSGSGGADGGGNAYSASLLGPALSWDGCLFTMGSANANDSIVCSGQTLTLPSGQFSSLQILASANGGAQTAQQFLITYTDGATSTFIQSLSDWTAPQNFPGETVAAQTAYRNTSGGTKDTVSQGIVYGYSFGLNNTKTVKSIKLPDDGGVLVFAMTLANDFTLYGSPSSYVDSRRKIHLLPGGGSGLQQRFQRWRQFVRHRPAGRPHGVVQPCNLLHLEPSDADGQRHGAACQYLCDADRNVSRPDA